MNQSFLAFGSTLANRTKGLSVRLTYALARGGAKAAGGLLVAALAASSAQADGACPDCERVTGGAVIVYYFDAADKLVAGEKVDDSRLIKPSTKSGMELLMGGACVAMPDPPAAQTTIQVGGGVSTTAVYVQTAGSPSKVMGVLAVEDMQGVTDRKIRPIRVSAPAGPVCRCTLVWCGPVKCCPCP